MYKKLSNLIGSIETITKNKQGFGYTYLELVKLYDEVLPKIKENGFVLVQTARKTDGIMTRDCIKPFCVKQNNQTVPTDRDEKLSFTAPLYELHSELIELDTGNVCIACDMPLYTDDLDPQAIGSAETYMRRYSVFAMLGIKTEDDDAFKASPKGKKNFDSLSTIEDFTEAINNASLAQLKALYWKWKDKPFAKEVKKISDARKLALENPNLSVNGNQPVYDFIPY